MKEPIKKENRADSLNIQYIRDAQSQLKILKISLI